MASTPSPEHFTDSQNRDPAVTPAHDRGVQEVSLLRVGSILIRSRYLIIAFGLIGGFGGLALGLSQQRVYQSSATFLPEANDAAASGLALAASQFGIRVPGGRSGWTPSVYVELLRSRNLLEPIALDTFTVAERGGARMALMDLLEIQAPTPAERLDRTLQALSGIFRSQELPTLGAVRVSATTPWASVSHALATRLVHGVNEFNLRTRRSQASEERTFVEGQAIDAEQELREAENQLEEFLQRNRVISGSPELMFERDRLQFQVELRQNVYASLLQSREEARLREMRDVAVITLLDPPRLPIVPEPRRSVLKGVVGGLIGGSLAVLLALARHILTSARQTHDPDAREFFALVNEAKPRFRRLRLPSRGD